MSINEATRDFERYRLNVKIRDGQNIQLVHDTYSGVDTWQTWNRRRRLGEGAFGEVWQEGWEDHYGDWHYRAVKVCSERKMRAAKIDYKRELLALAAFSKSECAAWFVNLHGWWTDSENVFVAMEYLGRGDLSRYTSTKMPEMEIKEIAENVLRGLDSMHKEGFTHRDIKPQNILVCQKRPEFPRWWVKIADFGISKQVPVDSSTLLLTTVGTRPYCAPEILGYLDHQPERSAYSSKVDMWSLGCVLFNLRSGGQLPFSDLDLVRYCDGTIQIDQRCSLLHLNAEGGLFLKALLQADPERRPSAAKALLHQWFKTNEIATITGSLKSLSTSDPPAVRTHVSFQNSDLSANSTLDLAQHISFPVGGGRRTESNIPQRDWSMSTAGSEPTRMQRLENIKSIAEQNFNSSLDSTLSENTDSYIAQQNLKSGKDSQIIKSRGWTANRSTLIATSREREREEPTPRQSTISGTARSEHASEVSTDSRLEDTRNGAPSWTAVQDLSQKRDDEMIAWLHKNKDSLDWGRQIGRTPIFLAVQQRNLRICYDLVDSGSDMMTRDKNGWTLLHTAAHEGHLDIVQWLTEHGADVESRDNDGRTPLYIASCSGHLEVVRWLAECAADIEARNKGSCTPLYAAACEGRLEVVRWLTESGANIDARNHYSNTPLSAAAYQDHLEVVRWLTKSGADIDTSDEHGWDPLSTAAYQGHLKVVQWLAEHGADITTKFDGKTLEEWARARGKSEVATWLRNQRKEREREQERERRKEQEDERKKEQEKRGKTSARGRSKLERLLMQGRTK